MGVCDVPRPVDNPSVWIPVLGGRTVGGAVLSAVQRPPETLRCFHACQPVTRLASGQGDDCGAVFPIVPVIPTVAAIPRRLVEVEVHLPPKRPRKWICSPSVVDCLIGFAD